MEEEGDDVENGVAEDRGMPQMLPEYRARLMTGLKQFYKNKMEEGVLGATAFKILSYCCDSAHHHAHEPIDLWFKVCREISMGGLLQVRGDTPFR